MRLPISIILNILLFFEYFKLDSDNTSFFNQYNNVPQGFYSYNDKVFVTVPRRNIGIPSTLNFVQLHDDKKVYENPPLNSYPNFATNELDVRNHLIAFIVVGLTQIKYIETHES